MSKEYKEKEIPASETRRAVDAKGRLDDPPVVAKGVLEIRIRRKTARASGEAPAAEIANRGVEINRTRRVEVAIHILQDTKVGVCKEFKTDGRSRVFQMQSAGSAYVRAWADYP